MKNSPQARFLRKITADLSAKVSTVSAFSLIISLLIGLAWFGATDKNAPFAFLILALIFYLRFSGLANKIKINKRQAYLILIFLFSVFIFISHKIIEYRLPASYIPIAGLAMFITIIFNSLELSLVCCVLASYFSGFLLNDSYFFSLLFLISGISASLLVIRVRRRMQILTAGFITGALQCVLFWLGRGEVSFNSLVPNFLNGAFCAVVVTGILPLLENLFGLVTNISLLELSDFNHPLLKKMALEAPGTYYHSLIVGNLAEAAAESIGANSLLARIGAYYHDIGKLNNADYFAENQQEADKHSNLSPTMSKMVIINHIKEGVDLAKQYRLKPQIIDFINQHHGNSLVYYFYRKALEELEEDDKMLEEGFRYPGPKPASKETAIVLLADSVEAAVRSLPEPQAAKIEEAVHKIINNRFIDRQLDECELTLRDLDKIARIFTHMLSGIYHGRIKYPEFTRKDSQLKKHAPAQSARQPKADKESRA